MAQTKEKKDQTVYVMNGASNHSTNERVNNDFYATPPVATEWLLKAEPNLCAKIWEPACGKGHISEVLKANGKWVHSTDLVPRGYGLGIPMDFLSCSDEWTGDIVTNPPYDLAAWQAEMLDWVTDEMKDACWQVRDKMIDKICAEVSEEDLVENGWIERSSRTVSVEWDTDGKDVDDLPEEVEVPSDIDEEDIADWLSDEYGYCVESFRVA